MQVLPSGSVWSIYVTVVRILSPPGHSWLNPRSVVEGAIPWQAWSSLHLIWTELPVAVLDPGDSETVVSRFALSLTLAQGRHTCPAEVVVAIIIVALVLIQSITLFSSWMRLTAWQSAMCLLLPKQMWKLNVFVTDLLTDLLIRGARDVYCLHSSLKHQYIET